MTYKKCKSCGYKQEIRTDKTRKQTEKFRCYNCGHWNKMRLAAMMLVITLAIGATSAYAYEEQVDLPRSDYLTKTCNAFIFGGTTIWEFNCTWTYEETNPSYLPKDDGLELPVPESDTPMDDILRHMAIYFEEQITIQDETVEEPPIKQGIGGIPYEELDPEVREAIDKLGICQFGDGVWSGIVANYTKEVPDELPIFTSGLDKRPLLGKLAKAYEECRGKTNYPWLSQQYEDVYLADLLGLDRFDRPNLSFGLDERRLYEEQRTASQEEKDQAERDSKDYMCRAENLHLKLCSAYMELQGENRGNPEPVISDKDAYNQYLSDQAGSILTKQDYANFLSVFVFCLYGFLVCIRNFCIFYKSLLLLLLLLL